MPDVARVTFLPDCDICILVMRRHGGHVAKATVDGKTRQGPWGHMCERHFGSHGVGLGTGLGQRLVVVEK